VALAQHALRISAILFADLDDDQDPAVEGGEIQVLLSNKLLLLVC
jgi:hypothetical protein